MWFRMTDEWMVFFYQRSSWDPMDWFWRWIHCWIFWCFHNNRKGMLSLEGVLHLFDILIFHNSAWCKTDGNINSICWDSSVCDWCKWEGTGTEHRVVSLMQASQPYSQIAEVGCFIIRSSCQLSFLLFAKCMKTEGFLLLYV